MHLYLSLSICLAEGYRQAKVKWTCIPCMCRTCESGPHVGNHVTRLTLVTFSFIADLTSRVSIVCSFSSYPYFVNLIIWLFIMYVYFNSLTFSRCGNSHFIAFSYFHRNCVLAVFTSFVAWSAYWSVRWHWCFAGMALYSLYTRLITFLPCFSPLFLLVFSQPCSITNQNGGDCWLVSTGSRVACSQVTFLKGPLGVFFSRGNLPKNFFFLLQWVIVYATFCLL